jgi:hypothetical protein
MGKHDEQIVTVTVNGHLSEEARMAILYIVRAEHGRAVKQPPG